MKPKLLDILCCPETGQSLKLENSELISEDGNHRYQILNGIPRFASESNYANNFGFQWNIFSRTQLDSHSKLSISAERFWKATAWDPAEMKGRWVLDVGCGSGRFAEVALNAGANVVALDYSSAVDACYENLRNHENLHVIQGDVYALPFKPRSFSYVYSLGVLQHTPDVARSFAALPPLVEDGGMLCVDFYEKTFKSLILPKYWLRPFTKRIAKPRLFALLKILVPVLLSMSQGLSYVPLIGKYLKRIVPVADYSGELPLSNSQLKEWALLDTFDWLSPTYDNPQTAITARLWLEQANMTDIEVIRGGHLVARGRAKINS